MRDFAFVEVLALGGLAPWGMFVWVLEVGLFVICGLGSGRWTGIEPGGRWRVVFVVRAADVVSREVMAMRIKRPFFGADVVRLEIQVKIPVESPLLTSIGSTCAKALLTKAANETPNSLQRLCADVLRRVSNMTKERNQPRRVRG